MSKDECLKKNMIAAAAKGRTDNPQLTLIEAAQGWLYFKNNTLPKDKRERCQLCNTNMRYIVVIEHTETNMRLSIGGNCYRKLEYLKAHGELKAVSVSEVNKPIKDELDLYEESFETYLKWFLSLENLPPELLSAVRSALDNGYVPSEALSQQLVAYCREHRLLPNDRLFNGNELMLIAWLRIKGEKIADSMTINQAEALRLQFKAERTSHPELLCRTSISDEIALHCLARINGFAPNPKFVMEPNEIRLDRLFLKYGDQNIPFAIQAILSCTTPWPQLIQAMKETLPNRVKVYLSKNSIKIDRHWMNVWMQAAKRKAAEYDSCERPRIEQIIRKAFKNEPVAIDATVTQGGEWVSQQGRHLKVNFVKLSFTVDGQKFQFATLFSKAEQLKRELKVDWTILIKLLQGSIPKMLNLKWYNEKGFELTDAFERQWIAKAGAYHKQWRQDEKVRIKKESKQHKIYVSFEERVQREVNAREAEAKAKFQKDAKKAKFKILKERDDSIWTDFGVGINPRTQSKQWRCIVHNKTYVLSYNDYYDFDKRKVKLFCQVVKTLVPGKIYLVKELHAWEDNYGQFIGWYTKRQDR